ncbi:serine/threonine-protein kinase 33-like isoform X2 [Tenebrio molitor]|uniref:serine/threonine-protein kinase 33-like isoform X2 n=1 Tax=Tenebrio molitor TaxID=7067 RepID=UPI0036248720
MSFIVNGQKMMHAAVNTDPLQLTKAQELKQLYYGLKVRNIPHVKIAEMNELKVWYDFGEKIGEGGFGMVMSVKDRSTNKKWAMKVVFKTNVGNRLMLAQQEIQILKLIQHPHIIYLDRIYESSKRIYMIFEKCYGDFAKIYHERKPFVEKIAKKIISELVDAVAYLHKYDIVHRDLKMENILLGENPEDPSDEYYIKLTDFGLSIVRSGKGVDSMLHDFCGTLCYMAPEMITFRSYSQMCDMWSIGVILYMLVMGKFPFFSKNQQELQDLICTQDPKLNESKLSVEVTDLILLLLVKDPVKRMRATEVLQHPWILNTKITKGMHYNIMEKMKEWKSEMTVESGAVSDWVATSTDDSCKSKQPMALPKTNINFERRSSKKLNTRSKTPGSRDVLPKDASKTTTGSTRKNGARRKPV